MIIKKEIDNIYISHYAPVVIPTLNRYDHLKQCVESLAACTCADKTDLFIGLDYPPSEKYVNGWESLKKYVKEIKGFKSVTILERKVNYGAAKNTDELIKYISQKYDTFIYTEDDNVFSPCFLDFINKGLEKYRDDEDVVSISGYFENENFNVCVPKNNSVIKVRGSFNGWGFGSWCNKYQNLCNSVVEDYRNFIFSKKIYILKLFYRKEMFKRLYFWLDNKNLDRPCDITFSVSNYLNDKIVIYPTKPIVKNMGYDGTGENCGLLINDYHSKRQICSDKEYDLSDSSTKKSIKKITKQWNKVLEKLYLSRDEKQEITLILLIGLFFNFKQTRKIAPKVSRLINGIKRRVRCFVK